MATPATLNLEVHGHRGCRGLRPENTIPAFLHALQLGVDVLELDIVLSADRQIVVSHEPWMSAAICLDPQGQRIDAVRQQEHNLYQLPYAQIRHYDCGQLQHPAFPKQQTMPACKPLLREVVRTVDALARGLSRPLPRFSVEVKSTPQGEGQFYPAPMAYAAAVLQELRTLELLQRSTLLCFDPRILQATRRQMPALPLCLLVEDQLPLHEHLQTLGFTPTVYGPQHTLVTPEMVAQAAQLSMQLVPWTVNEIPDMLRLSQLGVAGLTTDYPDRLLSLRAS